MPQLPIDEQLPPPWHLSGQLFWPQFHHTPYFYIEHHLVMLQCQHLWQLASFTAFCGLRSHRPVKRQMVDKLLLEA